MQNSLNPFFKTLAIVIGLALGWYITYLVTPTQRVHYSLYSALNTPYKNTQVDFSSKKLKKLPSEISRCLNLHTLILAKNNLKTFPKIVCQLPKLKNLDLSHNLINKLPSKFRFSTLTKLNLSWNTLEELPSSIEHLTTLRELDLSGNLICDLPPSFIHLYRTLRVLNLSYNPIDSATLKSIQQKLPNTKVIFANAPSLSSDYKSFCTQRTKENVLDKFYEKYSPSVLSENNDWFSNKEGLKKMYQCTQITIESKAIYDYSPSLFRRLYNVQEIYLKGSTTKQNIEYLVNAFPNLKGLVLDHNISTTDLLEFIDQTELAWFGLALTVHENGELPSPIPQDFYKLKKTKIIHMQDFDSYWRDSKFPEIMENIDAVVLDRPFPMPSTIEKFNKKLKMFVVEGARGSQPLRYFTELEVLDINSKIVFMLELDFLAEMKNLKELYLDDCNLKKLEKGLVPYLQNLEHLELLSIKGHQDKELNAENFQVALPNVKIIGL
ncbi:MAG: leucine-rich repeat domain-containing protein [Aureispira sp.]|nr:leucine-rich repeat domain-containing protein [Aureispira sp.]